MQEEIEKSFKLSRYADAKKVDAYWGFKAGWLACKAQQDARVKAAIAALNNMKGLGCNDAVSNVIRILEGVKHELD